MWARALRAAAAIRFAQELAETVVGNIQVTGTEAILFPSSVQPNIVLKCSKQASMMK